MLRLVQRPGHDARTHPGQFHTKQLPAIPEHTEEQKPEHHRLRHESTYCHTLAFNLKGN